ncbi:MAG: DUF1476 domain-containing protein [Rhodospirillales bacterium]
MADTLREIERGHEAKYKLDEELRFKVRCRCNRSFGVWAARYLGMAGTEAESYARSLVRLDLDAPRPGVVLATVIGDFRAAGVRCSESEVKSAFHRLYAEAADEVGDVYPMPLDTDHMRIGG